MSDPKPLYKPGTKVIHVGNSWHFGRNEKLTVLDHYVGTSSGLVCYWVKESNAEPILERDVVSEEVFNSPLYNAIKEEDV